MARKVTPQRNFNYFNKITVVNGQFGATNPDIIIGPFIISQLTFQNEGSGATNVVEYSFNGLGVDGELDPTKASASLTFQNRQVSSVWFRLKAGSSGSVVIRIEAYSV